MSQVIGPEGGTIVVTDPSSPLFGIEVEIPAEALEQETTITLSPFSKSDLEQQIGTLSEDMRFFGGLKIDGSEAILKKAISIFIPDSLGVTSDDQLLVGQVVDLDAENPSEMVYEGVTHIDSSLGNSLSSRVQMGGMFNVPGFGSFGVLSPTNPLGLIGGTFVGQSSNPVSDGIIATSFSKPFVSLTDTAGYFEIPAGPAGSNPAVMACVNTTGMAKGDYECTITITGGDASNSPQTCVIRLKVK